MVQGIITKWSMTTKSNSLFICYYFLKIHNSKCERFALIIKRISSINCINCKMDITNQNGSGIKMQTIPQHFSQWLVY
jgi:hypothetical protein